MRKALSVLLAATALSGCATYNSVNRMNSDAQDNIAQAQKNFPQAVQSVQAPYLLGPAVKAAPPENPALRDNITLVTTSELPIREVAGRIADLTGLAVNVTGLSDSGSISLPTSPPASVGGLPPPPAAMFAQATASSGDEEPTVGPLHYSGTLRGLLNTLQARTGLSWKFDADGALTLFRTETKSFIIPALPMTNDAQTQIAASAGASTEGGAISSTSGGGGQNSSTSSSGNTTITAGSSTDVWKSLEDTAKSVAGGASVSVDESTGMVTVTGTPDQVQQVRDWVHGLQSTLSQQVVLTVNIYSVSLTNENNMGFNPSLAFENAAKSWGLTMTGAPPPAVSSGGTPMSFGASILDTATGTTGEFSGTKAAIQALASLGRVSEVYSQSRVTLNGQQAAIQNADQIGYLAESAVSQTANVGSTSTLTPGTITTGFTGLIVPRIMGDKVYLGMDMTIAQLVSITKVSSGGSSIQVPHTTDTVVTQQASLSSGDTLMITGYQESDATNTNNGVGSPFNPLFGGGVDSNTKKNLIAIVVTARIL